MSEGSLLPFIPSHSVVTVVSQCMAEGMESRKAFIDILYSILSQRCGCSFWRSLAFILWIASLLLLR